jgi:protein SCO1/2
MSVSSTELRQSERSPQRVPRRFPLPQGSVLWVVLALVPIVAVLAFAILQPVKVRPRIGLAPGYAFTEMRGAQLTSEDMRGKLVFYNFTYAGCQAPCVQTSTTMAQVQELVKNVDVGGLPVEFVTVSIDPQRDTPARLQEFAAEIGADTSNWHFVTGPEERLKNVIGGGFRMFYEPDGAGGYKLDPTMIMVDGNSIMRAIYERSMPDMATVQRDLELLATEVKNSSGPGKLVYEAAHLFLCYPPS